MKKEYDQSNLQNKTFIGTHGFSGLDHDHHGTEQDSKQAGRHNAGAVSESFHIEITTMRQIDR